MASVIESEKFGNRKGFKIVKVISDGQLAVNAPGFRVVIRFKKTYRFYLMFNNYHLFVIYYEASNNISCDLDFISGNSFLTMGADNLIKRQWNYVLNTTSNWMPPKFHKTFSVLKTRLQRYFQTSYLQIVRTFPSSLLNVMWLKVIRFVSRIQVGSNMTGTDLYVNKPHCAAAVRPWENEATTSTLPPARVRTCSVLSGSC